MEKKRNFKKRDHKFKNFYDLKTLGISQSAMKTFMSCRRKWMLNIGGLERKGTQINTHFGTIVHEMLDMVYQQLDNLKQSEIAPFVSEQLDIYLEENKDEIYIEKEQNIIEREMAIAIVEAYFKFFKTDRKNFSEIQPEYEFAVPYNDVTLRGKVDGVLRVKKKDLWQMEHKTKSRWDEESGLQALQFDFQNLMYSFVLNMLSDEPIKGVLYNIIRKPQLRRTKTESPVQFLQRVKLDIASRPEWYFMRYEIVYTKKDKDQFAEQLHGILAEIKMFCKGDLPDLQNQAHCLFPFKCEYLPICSIGSTQGLVLRDSVHPELDADFKPDTRILKRYGIDATKVPKQ